MTLFGCRFPGGVCPSSLFPRPDVTCRNCAPLVPSELLSPISDQHTFVSGYRWIQRMKGKNMFSSLNLYLFQVLQDERAERAALINRGREARRAERAERRNSEK